MPDISAVTILSYIKDITLSGALVFILWGGRQKWWVWGWQYDEEKARAVESKKDGKYWQDFAFSLLNANERITRRLPLPTSSESTREET